MTRHCGHQPPCPEFQSPARDIAQVLIAHPEQGWSLLCNGVVVFDDTGELLPTGEMLAPRRAPTGTEVRASVAGG